MKPARPRPVAPKFPARRTIISELRRRLVTAVRRFRNRANNYGHIGDDEPEQPFR